MDEYPEYPEYLRILASKIEAMNKPTNNFENNPDTKPTVDPTRVGDQNRIHPDGVNPISEIIA